MFFFPFTTMTMLYLDNTCIPLPIPNLRQVFLFVKEAFSLNLRSFSHFLNFHYTLSYCIFSFFRSQNVSINITVYRPCLYHETGYISFVLTLILKFQSFESPQLQHIIANLKMEKKSTFFVENIFKNTKK
jgi:hypothetical protein